MSRKMVQAKWLLEAINAMPRSTRRTVFKKAIALYATAWYNYEKKRSGIYNIYIHDTRCHI